MVRFFRRRQEFVPIEEVRLKQKEEKVIAIHEKQLAKQEKNKPASRGAFGSFQAFARDFAERQAKQPQTGFGFGPAPPKPVRRKIAKRKRKRR